MDSTSILLIILGIFFIVGAGLNWDWFMTHRRARFITRVLGNRMRARIFYAVIGVIVILAGIT